MPKGGKRDGAGRKVGTPNKASQERQKEVQESGATPLDALIRKMRFHLDVADRLIADAAGAGMVDADALSKAMDKASEAARDAAPYVHPRLASTQVKGDPSSPLFPSRIEVVIVDPQG